MQPLTVEQAEHDGLEDVALLGRDLAGAGPKSAACIGYCNNNNSNNSNNSVGYGVQLAGSRRTCSASPRPSTCRAMPVSGFRESPCGAIAFRVRDAACPLSTRGGTRLVRLVRGRGGGEGGTFQEARARFASRGGLREQGPRLWWAQTFVGAVSRARQQRDELLIAREARHDLLARAHERRAPFNNCLISQLSGLALTKGGVQLAGSSGVSPHPEFALHVVCTHQHSLAVGTGLGHKGAADVHLEIPR